MSTFGLKRFGAPELSVERVPIELKTPLSFLLTGLAQTVIGLTKDAVDKQCSEDVAIELSEGINLTATKLTEANPDVAKYVDRNARATITVSLQQPSEGMNFLLTVCPQDPGAQRDSAWLTKLVDIFLPAQN